MTIDGKFYSEPELLAKFKAMEQDNKELKNLLKLAVKSMNYIAESVREECEEYACGCCEYDSPFTESGEMVYECPGCVNGNSDCFRWVHADEAFKLIGGAENV